MTGRRSEHSGEQRNALRNRLATGLIVALVLVGGAALRFTGLNWDDGHLLHPDDRFLAWVAADLETPPSLAAYFDTTTSKMNPNNVGPPHAFFVYGTLPVFLAHFAGQLVGRSSLYEIYLVGRALAATADLLTIVMIMLLARRLFDRRVGVLAGALYAFAALPIQQSHFFTVDTFTNLFAVTAFLFAVRLYDRHRIIDYVLFGLMLGLGMASKLTIAPLALILILALGLRVAREAGWPDGQPDGGAEGRSRRQLVLRAAGGLVLAGLVTVAVFRIAQPYAFLPPHSDVAIDSAELGPAMTLLSRLGDPIGLRPNPDWLRQMREVSIQVSGGSDIPPNHQWGHRLPLIFPWVNMVRVGLGWPLGILAWAAVAWGLWELARGSHTALRLMLSLTWTLLFFIWQGVGWVTTMRYFLPIYPHLLILAAWALVTLWDRVDRLLTAHDAPRWHWPRVVAAALATVIVVSGALWGFAVSRIYTRPVTRVAATKWIVENVPGDITLLFNTPDGPREYQIGLSNAWPVTTEDLSNTDEEPIQRAYLEAGTPYRATFELPFDGTLTAIRFNHVTDPIETAAEKTLAVQVLNVDAGNDLVTSGVISDNFTTGDDWRGESYTVNAGDVPLEASHRYALAIEPGLEGPLILAGSTIAVEGDWDDPVPLLQPTHDVWGALYNALSLSIAWEDTPEKRAHMQYVLDQADYLTISSNRFYDSLRRNPRRWPMTLAYYQALLSGDLGFELVADFTSRPNLGPIAFVDDTAEEAWTVYDHPRVFVFRKTTDYDPARTAEILDSVDLDTVERRIAGEAEGRPVKLPVPRSSTLPEAVTHDDWYTADNIEASGYDPTPTDIYLRVQPLAVLIWWLVVALVGAVAFPLLWIALPGLPDRGYAVARMLGLLLTAWLAWMAASLNILPWTAGSVWLALLLVAIFSAALIWPRRAEFIAWLRSNRRHLLIVEAGLAVLFLIFVLIRLGNPDLWHPYYGGEKPMDLAYLNAVLRSRSFPPYDPWFAGGTINYYYFGFVVAGLPIKLLGMPVTLAYNLALPTLFALTGGGAFAAAFNLVAEQEFDPRDIRPYLAGLAALLLAVVLGNLDEIRTMLWALAEAGTGTAQWTVKALPPLKDVLAGVRIMARGGTDLPMGIGEWYWNATRVIPVPLDSSGLPAETGPITEFPFFTFLYADLHAHMMAFPMALLVMNWCIGTVRGATREQPLHWWQAALAGAIGALTVGALRATNTWDYPTYLVLAVAALILASFTRRNPRAAPALVTAGIGAVLVGGVMFYTTISSEASLAIGIAGVLIGAAAGFLVGLAILQISGDDGQAAWGTLLRGSAYGGAFAIATAVLFLPFIANYEVGYDHIVTWEGSKTALWATIDILGLFLFIIVSWLIAELWPQVRGLKRKYFVPLIVALAALAAAVAVAMSAISPVALIALPLMIAALVAFWSTESAPKRITLILLLAALALTLVVEVLRLEGDLDRMNTVFKFNIQVWLLLAVAGGAAMGWLLPRLERIPAALHIAWMAALSLLICLATLYPLMATRAKIVDRWNPDAPVTLDGMAYMPTVQTWENGAVIDLAEDYRALRWLQDNIDGNPIMLEGLSSREYLWGNRVSVYTGLPSVVGWSWHQRQQRPPQAPEVLQRHLDVAELYITPSASRAAELLAEYDVGLIYVGGLERAYYGSAGLEKFERMAYSGALTAIYRDGTTVIYRVDDLTAVTS